VTLGESACPTPYRLCTSSKSWKRWRHRLRGRHRELKGFSAVTVRANWRVIFRFVDHDAFDVDYVDYH
jgi:plasmid maintenance system killer protein